MKLLRILILTSLLVPLMALAQTSDPNAGGLQGFINSHGGPQGSLVILIYCLNAFLSAIRDILSKLDGVAPGDVLTADKFKALTFMNKACVIVGKTLDYLTANTQH